MPTLSLFATSLDESTTNKTDTSIFNFQIGNFDTYAAPVVTTTVDAYTLSGPSVHTIFDTYMQGDLLYVAITGSALNTVTQLKRKTYGYRGGTDPDGVNQVQLSNPATVTQISGMSSADSLMVRRISPRAFSSGYVLVDLPFPLHIASATLKAYGVYNLETTHTGLPGRDTASGTDHNDYCLLDIPELQHTHAVVSNNNDIMNYFAVLPTADGSGSNAIEGDALHCFNGSANVTQTFSARPFVRQLRLMLRDRHGAPLLCHRAHFWMQIEYSTKKGETC
jgi:hypothetical protein